MTENDVIEIMRNHLSGQFPKECRSCGRRYETFADFIRDTVHVGKPVSYDAEEGDWQPRRPIGTVAFSNCACGSTLVLTSSGMGMLTLWRLMRWGRKEAKIRGTDTTEVLADLRRKIDERVLADQVETSLCSTDV